MKKIKEKNVPRLQSMYAEFASSLKTDLALPNMMQVPKLTKIVVNIGVGEATQNIKALEAAVNELTAITGQKPIMTRAKKSIATFKVREGAPIGCCVTLRRQKMYEFLDRFINVAVPRIRDFKGFSVKSFDGRGNYSVGIKEQIIFPEIDFDKISKLRGIGITIATDANDDVKSRALLEKFNFPFRK